MIPGDPFEVLGLDRLHADADQIRAARRRLAKDLHPDVGGDSARMAAINRAAEQALVALHVPPSWRATSSPSATPAPVSPHWSRRVAQDVPSFTIEALPAEAFEALLVVAAWIGTTLVDDPPYLLEAHLDEPAPCWCRLEIAPDAGASTVSLMIAGPDGAPAAPTTDDVRDTWIANLNRLDWQEL